MPCANALIPLLSPLVVRHSGIPVRFTQLRHFSFFDSSSFVFLPFPTPSYPTLSFTSSIPCLSTLSDKVAL